MNIEERLEQLEKLIVKIKKIAERKQYPFVEDNSERLEMILEEILEMESK